MNLILCGSALRRRLSFIEFTSGVTMPPWRGCEGRPSSVARQILVLQLLVALIVVLSALTLAYFDARADQRRQAGEAPWPLPRRPRICPDPRGAGDTGSQCSAAAVG